MTTESRYPVSIILALHQVMEAVPYVLKTGKNAHFGYQFASESDVLASLRPAMLAAGLVIIPQVFGSTIDEKGRALVRMGFLLCHKDGAVWPDLIPWEGCGMDTQDKMIAKAITSCIKYFMLKLFQIETGTDPDHDEALKEARKSAPKSATPEAVAEPPAKTAPAPSAKGKSLVVERLKQRIEEQLVAGGAPKLREWWVANKDQIKASCNNRNTGVFNKGLWTVCCITIKQALESVGDLEEGEKIE